MTGHQPHPGVKPAPPGYGGQRIDLTKIVRALGVDAVEVVHPLHYDKNLQTVKALLSQSGVRVLISRCPCTLYVQRLSGRKKTRTFYVGPECRDCRHCLDYFGCPALHPSLVPGEGGRMVIDEAQCAGCGFCSQWCEAIHAK